MLITRPPSVMPAARAVRGPSRAGAPADTVRRLLLATDLTSASESATQEALAIVRQTDAALVVLSVVDPRLLRSPGGMFLRRVDQERSRIQVGVQAIVARARAAGVDATFLVWEGEPSDTILEAADAEDVDVIVMGTHGRGRLGRLLRGSTSERVSRESRRRVLVIQS